MGLFGNLFKSKKAKDDEQLGEIKKDKRLWPVLGLIEAMRQGDEGEIRAALSKPMVCWKCGQESPVGDFLQQVEGKKGWLMTKCPKHGCGAAPILFGPSGSE